MNPLKMITPPAEPIARENMPAFEKAKKHAFQVRDSLQVVEYYRRTVLEPLGELLCSIISVITSGVTPGRRR